MLPLCDPLGKNHPPQYDQPQYLITHIHIEVYIQRECLLQTYLSIKEVKIGQNQKKEMRWISETWQTSRGSPDAQTKTGFDTTMHVFSTLHPSRHSRRGWPHISKYSINTSRYISIHFKIITKKLKSDIKEFKESSILLGFGPKNIYV